MERSHKRGAEAACGRTPPGQPAKKRRVLLTNLSLTPTSAPTASPPASLRPNASVSQRAVCPPSLPGSFAQPSLPQPATPAAPAAACALLCLPSNGLLQAYDPLHVRTPQLPYVPLRVAHAHSKTVAHHDQPIYLSKLQDISDRQLRQPPRTPHTAQPHLHAERDERTAANERAPPHSRAGRSSRQTQADGGEAIDMTAVRVLGSTTSPSSFKRRTSAERTVATPHRAAPALSRPPLTVRYQPLLLSDDSSAPDMLSPALLSQSSLLPAISTPPRAASHQRRTSSLFSLPLSSSSSTSTGSLPLPVSRSLSFQAPSFSSLTTAFNPSQLEPTPASTFDTFDGALMADEQQQQQYQPLQLVSPPPLLSKKSASHLRMSHRTHQPSPACPQPTPSKEERKHDGAIDGDKENAAPPSVDRNQSTPRSHKDLFAVKSVTTPAMSAGRRRRAHDVRPVGMGEERLSASASALRVLRSIR